MPAAPSETCGWLICGDPERPCVRTVEHPGQHRDAAYRDWVHDHYRKLAQDSAYCERKREYGREYQRKRRQDPAYRERKREYGREYRTTAAGILADVQYNAKRRGNR